MPVPELTQYRVYTYDPYFGPQWYFDREAHKRDLAKLARTTQEPEELWEILKEGSDYQDDPSFIQAFLDNPATPPRLLFTLAEARVRQGNSVGYILAHILDRARSGDEEARKVLQEEQRRYLENSDLFYSYEERWRLFLFRDDQSPLLAKVPELLQGILQDDTTHQSRAYLCAVILAEALAGDHALDPETYFLWARALQKLGGDERRKLARLLIKRGGPWLHLALLHNPLAPVSLEDLPPRVVVQAASLHVHWRSDHHAELRLNRPPTGSLAETLAGVLEIPVVVVEALLKHPEAELEHLLDLRRIYDNAPRKAKVSWREFCIPWIARYLPPDLLRLADKHLLARDLVNL